QFAFNRASNHTFCQSKLLFTFLVLAGCGLLVVFFRGLALHAGQWVLLSLTFLPIFLSAGVLFAMGILLIRVYHDEIKKRDFSYLEIVGKSWEILVGASYLSVPIILGYLVLWMVMGVFYLLREIPAV